ncbi:MAG: hypothetical protein O3A88_02470 [Proteobacteria bacterium]|nr:hypothetical protein [Pseudomonadota bacterium]
MENSKDDLSDKAWEWLKREQNYLMQARLLFRQSGDDEMVQMEFAVRQDELARV